MKNSFKKRGRKLTKKLEEASLKSKKRIKDQFISRISHIKNIRLLVLEWSLLISALIMLAVAQAFWYTNSYAEDTFVAGGTYVEATLGKVGSLNPLFALTSSEKTLSRLLFSTLVSVDYTGHPSLDLAKTLTPSENGKVWTLTLKDNLFWSNGAPLTNADVLFTINLIKSPAVNSVYSANLENVRVTETETGEIIFTLPVAYADFNLALDFPIVPKRELEDTPLKTLIEDDFSNNPITSGAFSFNAVQSTASENEKIYYLSNNPYYHLGKPMLSSFAIHTYNSKEDLASALSTGSVTATAELSGNDFELVNSTNFITKNSPLSSGAFIFFNLQRDSLKNADFRTALRQGIDLSALRAAAPNTEPLNYPLIDTQIHLSNYPALPSYNFSAASAKIAELSGENRITLNITTVNSGYLPAVAEILAENLRTLGIQSEVITYAENQEFITNIISKRNYDILLYEIELGADPDLIPYYHSSQVSASGINLSNYKNTLVDDLLVAARETLDFDLRAKKYESFLQYWVTDVPAIAIYRPNLTYLYNKNVRTFSDDLVLVAPLDRFNDIYNWASVRGRKDKTP